MALTLAVTGCGSSGPSDAGSTSSDAATTVATTLASASPPDALTTVAATGEMNTATRSGAASTAVAGSYCEAASAAQAATDAFNALGADPRSTENPAAVFDAYVATINELAASAPAELVADLQRNADAMAKLKPILAAAGYDVSKAFEDPAINTILTAEVNAGSQRINAYNASTCGLSGTSTTTSLAAP
ncbi:MAG: hypothetical protein AB7V43_10425 [Acidimicrobiia bacterium]